MADRLGVAPDEAIGLLCYEHVHGTEEPPPFCPHSKLLTDGQEHLTEVYEKGLGGYFLVTVSPFHDDKGRLTGSVHVARDINERKKAEETLWKSEERYRTLIGAIPDPLVVYDPEGKATYVNDAFEQVYGWSREELLGDRIDFVPPEEAEATQKAWKRTLLDGTVFFETKRRNKNGDLLDIQLRTAILRDQKGKHVSSIVIHRDVTSLKKAERELQESQTNLQILFNSLDDFLFVLDMEGYIIQVNPVVLNRLGYSEPELLGEHVLKVHPLDRHEEALAIIADMAAGKTESCHIPLMGKDGTKISIETKVTRGHWGNQDVLFGISRDITERKQAEAALRKSESLLSNTFSAIPDLLTVHDLNLRIVLSNWHGHEYVPDKERVGQPYCYKTYMHRDTPCEPCHALEVFETGKPKQLEMTNPVDGITREINVYPIFDEAGEVMMVTEHIRDISDRIKAVE